MSVKNVKLLCLGGFIGFAIFSFAFNKSLTEKTGAFSSGPPPETTGAPGEGTCAQCHIGGVNNGQFSIIAPANYTPGQTYQIQVRHTNSDPTRRRWGFELTALANNSAAGTFANLTTNTQTLTAAQRNYIEHSGSGTFVNQTGSAVWIFNWTAPAFNVGVVTFYAAGNQANNDNNSTGDQIYTTNTTSQPVIVPPTHTRSDFDGDGKADVSVFRPSNTVWYASRSSDSQVLNAQWGLATDKIVPADYNGDGKTDYAVFRDGVWYILQTGGGFQGYQWGNAGDLPFPADFDGDGKDDLAVFPQRHLVCPEKFGRNHYAKLRNYGRYSCCRGLRCGRESRLCRVSQRHLVCLIQQRRKHCNSMGNRKRQNRASRLQWRRQGGLHRFPQRLLVYFIQRRRFSSIAVGNNRRRGSTGRL